MKKVRRRKTIAVESYAAVKCMLFNNIIMIHTGRERRHFNIIRQLTILNHSSRNIVFFCADHALSYLILIICNSNAISLRFQRLIVIMKSRFLMWVDFCNASVDTSNFSFCLVSNIIFEWYPQPFACEDSICTSRSYRYQRIIR